LYYEIILKPTNIKISYFRVVQQQYVIVVIFVVFLLAVGFLELIWGYG